MGADPKTSAVDRYLQSWDVPNLFVTGATAFPQNAGYNPTGTVGALAYWAADAIRRRYLKSPGPLVPACFSSDRGPIRCVISATRSVRYRDILSSLSWKSNVMRSSLLPYASV
jgi:hypothetical protein